MIRPNLNVPLLSSVLVSSRFLFCFLVSSRLGSFPFNESSSILCLQHSYREVGILLLYLAVGVSVFSGIAYTAEYEEVKLKPRLTVDVWTCEHFILTTFYVVVSCPSVCKPVDRVNVRSVRLFKPSSCTIHKNTQNITNHYFT